MRFRAYRFGSPVGDPFLWFAWYPVRTQSGQWVWLRKVQCLLISKKSFLDGPDWQFYAYAANGRPIQQEYDAAPKVVQAQVDVLLGLSVRKGDREGAGYPWTADGDKKGAKS